LERVKAVSVQVPPGAGVTAIEVVGEEAVVAEPAVAGVPCALGLLALEERTARETATTAAMIAAMTVATTAPVELI